MTRLQILTDLKDILTPYVINKEALDSMTDGTDLIQELGIDSVDLIDIIINIEDHYNIEIENSSIKRIHIIGQCIDLIAEKTS